MKAEINKRIEQFIQYKQMSVNAFAKLLGYASSEKIARLVRDSKANPSFEIIYDITNMFVNELNAEWLILGKGEMLKDARHEVRYTADINQKPKSYIASEPDQPRLSECQECIIKNQIILSQQKQVETLTEIVKKLTDNRGSE